MMGFVMVVTVDAMVMTVFPMVVALWLLGFLGL